MKIAIEIGASRTTFTFQPDDLDAIPYVDTVWFEGATGISPGNLALMGYLMARQSTANVLSFVNVEVPAHLAARMIDDFPAHELFVSPITNQPERIAARTRHETLWLDRSDKAGPWLQRHDLGYRVMLGDVVLKDVHTNIDLHATFLPEQTRLSELVVYLALHHELGIRSAGIAPSPNGDLCSSARLAPLLREVASDLICRATS